MPLFPSFSQTLRQRLALWIRLEPRARSKDFARGIAAPLADPLWLLARQWQMGEFAGSDAGSPMRADLQSRTATLSHVKLGSGPEMPLDGLPPLEALVEREPVEKSRASIAVNYRMRVRAGQRLEREVRRLLGAAADPVIIALRQKYPLTQPSGANAAHADRASRRYLALMVGRVTDGLAVLAATDGSGGVAGVANAVSAANAAQLQTALNALRSWRSAFLTEPSGANTSWVSNDLSYSFMVRAADAEDGDTKLSASRYRNGDMDWYSFTAAGAPAANGAPVKRAFLPTGVSFGGMPNRRWWAFEDGRTDFGSLDVATTDVAKLALMEFALIYSDDWFLYPLTVPTGSVTRIKALNVTDTFGRVRNIPSGRTDAGSSWKRWEMYTLSRSTSPRAPGVANLLFVPPAIGFREESEPLEQVRFGRDEGANKVWGIERTIVNALGDPVGGAGAHREFEELRQAAGGAATSSPAAPTVLTADEASLLRYKLGTPVPHNWVPYAPYRANSTGTLIRLRRAAMLDVDGNPEPIAAISQLLSGNGAPTWLDEEAVLRNGLTVQLRRQRVRWVDGKTYVWLGRSVRIGRGEASSGLRFDVVTDPRART